MRSIGAVQARRNVLCSGRNSRAKSNIAVRREVAMREGLWVLPVAVALIVGTASSAFPGERRSGLVHYSGVQIEVVMEGAGPTVVLLPSLARDSDDYDAVAEGLAAAGFLVLRPKPRGIGRSIGPMTKITLHDLARDIAEVVEQLGGGRAIIVGHAFGNWVARMTAADHPKLVRGVVIAAAAAKHYAPELSKAVTNAGNPALSREERLAALRFAFFAPGNDPTGWLNGWHPDIRD